MKEQHSLGFGRGCTNQKKKKKSLSVLYKVLFFSLYFSRFNIFLSYPISGGIPLLYIGLRIAS